MRASAAVVEVVASSTEISELHLARSIKQHVTRFRSR